MNTSPDRPKPKMSPEDFVAVWNTSKSIEEFLAKTGMNRPAAWARCAAYRKKGIKMNRMSNYLSSIERLEEVMVLAEQTAEVWDFDATLERYSR